MGLFGRQKKPTGENNIYKYTHRYKLTVGCFVSQWFRMVSIVISLTHTHPLFQVQGYMYYIRPCFKGHV